MPQSRFYTDEEYQAAKAYLKDRLRNEQSMSRDIEVLLISYASSLLSAMFDNASDEDIEQLVSDLVSEILADCETLAVDEHGDRDGILMYMLGERNGDTLEGRISKRCHTFLNEITAVYLAGKLLGLNKTTLLSSVMANFKHPWDNEVLVAVREKIQRGDVAGNLEDFAEPHFGKGIEISSLGALDTLTEFAIGDAWMYWEHEDALARGAKGYFVERGSSYPCEECDSHCGIFYPMSDTDNRPQYHNHCCCIVIYTYVERI